jgi:hypothetical protein
LEKYTYAKKEEFTGSWSAHFLPMKRVANAKMSYAVSAQGVHCIDV